MKIGLFRSALRFEAATDNDKIELLGNNTGNMLFWHSLKSIFDLDFIQVNDSSIDQYDSFITTDLIWLRENIDMSYLNDYIDKIGNKPLIPISVGLQANSFKVDFKMHPKTIYLLSKMSERCVLGIRGYYTAEVLYSYGIKNIQVVGCPSMYFQLNADLNIQHKNDPKMVTTNFSTFYAPLTVREKHFLSYCADKNYSFVEQTKYPLEIKHTHDEKYFNYVNQWLSKQKRIFYNIDEWSQYTKQFDFSMGGRFHGNVIALWNQIPALFFACDSRTMEMCEFFRLPYVTFEEFNREQPIEYYYERADYTSFNKHYKERLNSFINFSKSNKLEIDLRHSLTPQHVNEEITRLQTIELFTPSDRSAIIG